MPDKAAEAARPMERMRDEIEKLLSLAEQLQQRVEERQSSTSRAALMTLTALIALFALTVGGTILLRNQLSGEWLALLVVGVAAGFGGYWISFLRLINRANRLVKRDHRALNEVVNILRETESVYAQQYRWSPLERAEFRIRISRFDIEHEGGGRPTESLLGDAATIQHSVTKGDVQLEPPVLFISDSREMSGGSLSRLDLSEITRQWEGLTTHQIEHTVESRYRGKWIHGQLWFNDLWADEKTLTACYQTYAPGVPRLEGITMVYLLCAVSEMARFSHLKVGDKVDVSGKILRMNERSISAQDPSLLE